MEGKLLYSKSAKVNVNFIKKYLPGGHINSPSHHPSSHPKPSLGLGSWMPELILSMLYHFCFWRNIRNSLFYKIKKWQHFWFAVRLNVLGVIWPAHSLCNQIILFCDLAAVLLLMWPKLSFILTHCITLSICN